MSNKSLYLCQKKKKWRRKEEEVSLDISKNIQVNLIKIKYNQIKYGVH